MALLPNQHQFGYLYHSGLTTSHQRVVAAYPTTGTARTCAGVPAPTALYCTTSRVSESTPGIYQWSPDRLTLRRSLRVDNAVRLNKTHVARRHATHRSSYGCRAGRPRQSFPAVIQRPLRQILTVSRLSLATTQSNLKQL